MTLPADVVQRPGNLPRYCSRHGLPAVRRVDFALQSAVRIEGSRFRAVGGSGALGMADRLGQHGKKVRVVHVRSWPLCGRCNRTRVGWLTLAAIMFFGGLTAFVGSLIVGIVVDGAQVLAAVAVGGFVLLPLAAFPFARGGLARIVGARTSPDGATVLVENPSQAFLAGLPR
ncbi:hypothetical protein [Actinophytocola gossypii]|uniref:hypothetical protein n=1 Tax=Actinophytocola gossypii TaxID=2812003 RepID=UPI0021A29CBD|nr:hypothetical protein [Actinophytocola gossypii]